MGLLTEVVPAGTHLERALEIAEALARFPQETMLADRRAAIEGIGMPFAEGMRLEAAIRPADARGRREAAPAGSPAARAAAEPARASRCAGRALRAPAATRAAPRCQPRLVRAGSRVRTTRGRQRWHHPVHERVALRDGGRGRCASSMSISTERARKQLSDVARPAADRRRDDGLRRRVPVTSRASATSTGTCRDQCGRLAAGA